VLLLFLAARAPLPYHVTELLWGRKKMKHDTSFAVLTGNNIETKLIKAGGVIFCEGDEAHARSGSSSAIARWPSSLITIFLARWH
jgi:hypothetical protein